MDSSSRDALEHGSTACALQQPSPNIPDCHPDLPTSTHETLDSTIRPPQDNDTPLQHSLLLNQAHRVRADLKAYLAGKFLQYRDKPRDLEIGIRLSYNSRTATLTLFTMQSPRHGYIIEWLHDIAEAKLDLPTRRKLFLSCGVNDTDFQGEWQWSEKQPDLAISWNENNIGTQLDTIIEVGVSQTYNSLLHVRDMFLKGLPEVSSFVSVNILEDPRYRSPKDLNIDEPDNIQKADFQLDADQGPLCYKGVQWMGKSTLSWEVWERGADGEPKQIFSATVDPSDRETELPFFEIPATIATGTKPVTVTSTDLDELYTSRLKYGIIDEARVRMSRYIKNVRGKRKLAADLAERKDEAEKKRSKATEERTERCRIQSERREKAADSEE
ncbi:hypothetical protein AYL99_11660 [Fonsecaea erecta]|uniref:Uncharacterized protein n=1 Tax=Fonsecaea erecta TaxID=1367422 RepID=A0A178Z4W6_9EURO|nr:hypothetical protein AYL99_11660 [Fonsecaea erecta]OAP54125.1 hypothetical protein AYL99_11660 [Fonsecaea erecta]